MRTRPCPVMKATLTSHYSDSILVKSINFLLRAENAVHYFYSDYVFWTQRNSTLSTIIILIPIYMQTLIAFLALHWFHASLCSALLTYWKPISFSSIFMSFSMLLSIPLCNTAIKWAVIFIRISENLWLLFLFDLLFSGLFVISLYLGHHYSVYASLFKAGLAFGIIIAPKKYLVNLSVATGTKSPWFHSFESVTKIFSFLHFTFVVDYHLVTRALFDDLIIWYVIKVIHFFIHDLLWVDVNFNIFYHIALPFCMGIITRHAVRVLSLLNFLEHVSEWGYAFAFFDGHLFETARVALIIW